MKHLRNRVLAGVVALVMLITAVITDSRPVLAEDKASSHTVETTDTPMPVEETGEKKADERNVGPKRDEEAMAHTLTPETKEEMVPDYPQVDPATDEIKSTVAPDAQKQSTTTDTVSQPMTKEKKEEADAPNTEKNVDKEKATATAGSFSYDFDVKWNNGISADVKDYHYEEDGEGNPDRTKLIFTPQNRSLQTATLHYDLDIHGDANTVLPEGAIKINVPAYLFETWDDKPYEINYQEWSYNADKTVKWQIPEAPESSTVSVFNYIDNHDGTFTVSNVRPISGSTKLSFDQAFPFRPHRVKVDKSGAQTRDLSIALTINSNKSVPKYSETHNLSVQVKNMTKAMEVDLKQEHLTGKQGVYFEWQDAWGTRPSDADQYFYVIWYADVTHPLGNTIPYTYQVIQEPSDGELVGVKKTLYNGSAIGFTHSMHFLNTSTDTTFKDIGDSTSLDTLTQIGLLPIMKNYNRDTSVTVNGFQAGDDWIYARFSMLKKYPISLLEDAKNKGTDLARDGFNITNTVKVVTKRDNGMQSENSDTEKQTIHVYPYAGVNHIWKYDVRIDETGGGTILPGTRTFLLNDEDRDLSYSTKDQTFFTHVESGALSEPVFDKNKRTYTVKPYTAEITEGKFYDTTNLSLPDYYNKYIGKMQPYDDADITYKSVIFSLDGYDAIKSSLGAWTEQTNPDKTKSRFSSIDLYTRKVGETNYTLYGKLTFDSNGSAVFQSQEGSILIKNAEKTPIPLPSGIAGLRYEVHSSYFRFEFFARTTLTMHPTKNVKAILQRDKNNGKKSTLSTDATVTFTESASPKAKAIQANTYGQVLKQSSVTLTDLTPWFQQEKKAVSKVKDDSSSGLQDRVVEVSFNQLSSLWYTLRPDREYLKSYVYPKGTLYDLLPIGVQVPKDSIELYGGARSYTKKMDYATDYQVQEIQNWNGSGRTMLKIDYTLPPKFADVLKYPSPGFEIKLRYHMLNSYSNIVDHGNSVVNTCALKIDPSGTNNLVFEPADQVEKNFNNLKNHKSLESLVGTDFSHWRFVDATIGFNPVTVTQSGVVKKVQAKNDAVEKEETHAAIGTPYQYRLGYGTASNTRTDRLVFFDILDQGSRRGKTREDSDWQGVFDWVDVSSITNKPAYGLTGEFANPVIYYATTIPKGYDLREVTTTGENVWSTSQPKDKSSIKAIAVDCTKTNKGNDFILDQGASVSVYVHMTAPNDAALDGKTAVNETVSYARNFAGEKASDNLKTKEYTANAKITLHKPDLSLTKSSLPVSGTAQAPTEIDNKKDTLVEYTLTVKNNRTNKDAWATVKDVLLTDAIPAHLMVDRNKITVVKSTETDKKLSLTDAKIGLTGKGQDLQFHIPELAPGESLTFTIPTTLDDVQKQTTRFENTASITEVDGVKTNINSETTYHQVTVDIDIPVTKVWKDYDGSDLTTTPEKVTVALYGDQKQLKTLDLEKKDSWKGTFQNVSPNDSTGKSYTFTVKEVGTNANGLIQIGNDWYTASVAGDKTQGFTVTNTKHKPWMPIDPVKTSLTVTKAWSGVAWNYYDAASVTVELYKNGQATGMKATLNKANQFTATFNDLKTVDDVAQPQQNQYTVKELDANGKALANGDKVTILNKDYTVRYGQVAGGKQTITNTLVNPMRTISGKKIWNDRGNVDGLRPKTITVRLLADGKEVQKLTVDKGQDGKWEFAFTNCPTYDQGTPITYTISEDKVAFYTTKIDGTTITNSHRPKPTPPTPNPPTPVEPTPTPNPPTPNPPTPNPPTPNPPTPNPPTPNPPTPNPTPTPTPTPNPTPNPVEPAPVEPTPTPKPQPKPSPTRPVKPQPKTGDSNRLLFWSALLGVSTLSLTFLYAAREKTRSRKKR